MEGLIQLLLHPLLEIRMEFVKTMAKKGVEIDSPVGHSFSWYSFQYIKY